MRRGEDLRVADVIRDRAAERGDKVAVAHEHRELTYAVAELFLVSTYRQCYSYLVLALPRWGQNRKRGGHFWPPLLQPTAPFICRC